MSKLLEKFWAWYERHYRFNLTFATLLFVWQLVHLFWLTTHVVFARLFGHSFFDPNSFWQSLIIIVDYTEIPALVTTSLLYINQLRKKSSLKPIIFLILLNSQWLHLFWITDEFVISQFNSAKAALPIWLAWVAILIDYLELPVMVDTTRKLLALKKTDLPR